MSKQIIKKPKWIKNIEKFLNWYSWFAKKWAPIIDQNLWIVIIIYILSASLHTIFPDIYIFSLLGISVSYGIILIFLLPFLEVVKYYFEDIMFQYEQVVKKDGNQTIFFVKTILSIIIAILILWGMVRLKLTELDEHPRNNID